jgi:hypothetical protein
MKKGPKQIQIHQPNIIKETMGSTNQNVGYIVKTGLKQGLDIFSWLSYYLHCFF